MASEAIHAALTGRIGDHHRFLLGVHLRQYDGLGQAIAAIDAQVERDFGPSREVVEVPTTIPGIGDLTAQVILSEIGPDMSCFPCAGHLISWAGLCQRTDESTCKSRPTGLRKKASYTGARSRECDLHGHRLDDDGDPPHAQDRHGLRRSRARWRPQSCPHHPRQGLVRQIERLGFTCELKPVEPVSIETAAPATARRQERPLSWRRSRRRARSSQGDAAAVNESASGAVASGAPQSAVCSTGVR